MKKYIYEYVSISMPGPLSLGILEEHKNVINQYAENGWRYNGYIPTSKNSQGKTLMIDLIFEKEIEE